MCWSWTTTQQNASTEKHPMNLSQDKSTNKLVAAMGCHSPK